MAMVEKARDDRASWRDAEPKHVAAQGGRGKAMARLIPVAVPAMLLVAALVLPAFMFTGDRRPDVPGLGPAAWPNVVLLLLGVFSAIWLAIEVWGLVKWRVSTSLSAPHDEDVYHYGKALVGIGLVIAFGWLLPYVGFAIACAGFLLIWCLYGGLRNPFVLVLVPTLGTIALLWMFMGLALMPLSRGVGIFDQFSVALLQLLGIY
jgi:putative tricarboxylic transport membrane protein